MFYYDYQSSKAQKKFGDQILYVQLVLLLRPAGFISRGNLSAFNVISRRAREIAGNDIVAIGNEENFSWQHHNFNQVEHQSKITSFPR